MFFHEVVIFCSILFVNCWLVVLIVYSGGGGTSRVNDVPLGSEVKDEADECDGTGGVG